MFEHSHNYVHFYVNGDMSKGYSASNDIIFYLHHSMIDWILEHWRQNMQVRLLIFIIVKSEDSEVIPHSEMITVDEIHYIS